MTNLVWNVFYHDVNADRIEMFNIFKHGGLMEDLRKHYKKCKTKEQFSEELRRSLMYYFWSKCEWEVLITPWCGSRKNESIKVDVYWQIQNNWEPFLDYVWNAKKRRKTQPQDDGSNPVVGESNDLCSV